MKVVNGIRVKDKDAKKAEPEEVEQATEAEHKRLITSKNKAETPDGRSTSRKG
jgi:hypothetical protein